MMMQSQFKRERQLEEIKDNQNVIMCYRCQRAIRAVDRMNEVSKVFQNNTFSVRQMKINQMFGLNSFDRPMTDVTQQSVTHNSDDMMIDTSSH